MYKRGEGGWEEGERWEDMGGEEKTQEGVGESLTMNIRARLID